MLVLNRKSRETILIGDDIKITVVTIKPNSVVIGVDAPVDTKILRGELERYNDHKTDS